MATEFIMPALEMAQDTGKILRWLKREGEPVTKGEPLVEIETDKVTVEIEANASGILTNITAHEGDVVPVGQTIARIVGADEGIVSGAPTQANAPRVITASPVARKIAQEHGVDLARVKPAGGRIEKADVMAYLNQNPARLVAASPKARRLAQERGVDLAMLRGTGPDGAIIAADLPSEPTIQPLSGPTAQLPTVWRVMAERMTQSWTTVPHFFLLREVEATALVELRARVAPLIEKKTGVKPTITDLLVKLVAHTLREHPRVNASWTDGAIKLNDEVNVGIATAIEDGLIVPVIHRADTLSIGEITRRRQDIVERANANKLRPTDIAGGTFTLTNLGMYGIDAFNAIINAPQAAILAVGRIADRVVAVNGQPTVRPIMTLSLSSDHRVVDGARAAKFLNALAHLIEEPWALLV